MAVFCMKEPWGWHAAMRPAPIPRYIWKNARRCSCSCFRVTCSGQDSVDYRIQKVKTPSLKKRGWVHFIGIGGSGLSALAYYALKQDWIVSGSDILWSKKMEGLENAGARVHKGHMAAYLYGEDKAQVPDFVVLSSAIPSTNEELVEAEKLGLTIYKRGSWLAKVTEGHKLIAISGSHGKSTTTAMLSIVLKDMGYDISAIVGADVPQFVDGGSVLFGRGPRFVLEADEYDECFLSLSPHLVLITNVGWEHVDKFPDEASVRDCFKKFGMCLGPGGALLFCGDNTGARSVAEALGEEVQQVTPLGAQGYRYQTISYGLEEGNNWRATMVQPNDHGGSDYVAVLNGRTVAKIRIQIPGLHNVLNSLGVIAAVATLAAEEALQDAVKHADAQIRLQKIAIEAASKSIEDFRGIRRRFELVGVASGCHIYDDYAHHPTEVRAVLRAARQKFSKLPIWVIFQPHTYSRIAKLLKGFAMALSEADVVIVTKVHSAREVNTWGVSGRDLVNLVHGPPAIYIPNLDDVLEFLLPEVAAKSREHKDFVVLTLGAGSITNLGPRLLESLNH